MWVAAAIRDRGAAMPGGTSETILPRHACFGGDEADDPATPCLLWWG
jgi:hypothetical protein